MAYVGKKRTCGHVVMLTVDDNRHLDDLADMISEGIRDGLIFERTTIEEARRLHFGCHCDEQLALGLGEQVG